MEEEEKKNTRKALKHSSKTRWRNVFKLAERDLVLIGLMPMQLDRLSA